MSRIRRVDVTPIAFSDPPLRNSWGVHEPLALRTVVEIELADGQIGLGETSGESSLVAALRAAAPRLVGARVDDLAGLREAALSGGVIPADPVGAAKVIAPFEVAAWDARGHLEGVPVADLLGGAVRREVEYAGYLFYKWAGHLDEPDDEWGRVQTPAETVALAQRMRQDDGFRSFKLKAGVLAPEVEIATMRALAEALPDVALRMDPNAVWRSTTAIEVAAALADTLEYLEDPVRGIADMARVRAVSELPLATNMIAISPETLEASAAAGAVDIVLADHHYWGGLEATRRLGARCAELGLGMTMHSNSHLGISLAAMTHVAAATPELSGACDTHYPWNRREDVVTGVAPFVAGSLAVPEGPGLGVELRRDVLARLHRRYLESGHRDRDDTGYARRLDPGFDPRPPRF